MVNEFSMREKTVIMGGNKYLVDTERYFVIVQILFASKGLLSFFTTIKSYYHYLFDDQTLLAFTTKSLLFFASIKGRYSFYKSNHGQHRRIQNGEGN